MPGGFESYLDSGQAQLSAEQLSFTLVKSGLITNTNFPSLPVSAVCSFSIDLGSGFHSPIVFFKARGANSRLACRIRPEYVTGQGWVDRYAIDFFKWWNIPLGAPVEYFIFAQYRHPPNTYGMQLLGPTGELNFDATWPNLYIRKVMICPQGQPALTVSNSPSYVINPELPADSFAVGLAAPRQASLTGRGDFQGWVLMDCAYVEAGMIKVNWMMIDIDSTGYGPLPSVISNDAPLLVMAADTRYLPLPYG